jgi:hypothetical protein
MLMSASSSEVLTIHERLFDDSPVTPAARANDTSDIWVVRGGRYAQQPSRPFRSATIDQIQCGRVKCQDSDRSLGANLGLYSITFNNRLDQDEQALEEYRAFRLEAERRGFRHFLELFDPNAPDGLSSEQVPQFINDCVARTLAGVPQASRPLFLKMVYHGPKAMEELAAYDPHLVIGILGGGAGTTYDAFKLLAEAQKYGARVALFGRKINGAECQLAFAQFLRLIVERQISPEEAVQAYHGALQRLGIAPHRSLEDDLRLQTNVMSYHGASASIPAAPPSSLSPQPAAKKESCGCRGSAPAAADGHCACSSPRGRAAQPMTSPSALPQAAGATPAPDFRSMTAAEKLAYHQARRDRIFGK